MTDRICQGQTLFRNGSASLDRTRPHLASPDGSTWLSFQADGNLVLSEPTGKVLWSSKTNGRDGASVTLQGDSNLVIKNSHGQPIWDSKTNMSARKQSCLVVQNDGNMVLYDTSFRPPRPFWSTDSNGHQNRQDAGGWLENAVSAAGRAAGSVVHAVTGVAGTVGHTLGRVPLVGSGLKGIYGLTVGGPFHVAATFTSGQRLDKAAAAELVHQVQNVAAVAPYAQTVISFVPAIGPGISGALQAGLSLAQGKPLSQAMVDAAIAAVPGGAIVQSIAKVGIAAVRGQNIATAAIASLPIPDSAKAGLQAAARLAQELAAGRPIDKAALAAADSAVSALPEQFRKAFQVGIALGQGQNLQDVVMQQLPNLVSIGGPLAAEGLKLAQENPVIASARTLVAEGQHGFDVATGIMNRAGITPEQLARARSLLSANDTKGFDMAVALKNGQVTHPPIRGNAMNVAGYLVRKGVVGLPARHQAAIANNVVNHPDARAGAQAAQAHLLHKSWWQQIKEFFGIK